MNLSLVVQSVDNGWLIKEGEDFGPKTSKRYVAETKAHLRTILTKITEDKIEEIIAGEDK